jgi:uncharacterized protein YebE (UPF0316 family)
LDAWYLAVAYAAGYAVGNVVGISLESKLAIGLELVRAISYDFRAGLGEELRARGYSVIELNGRDGDGKSLEIILIEEKRRLVPRLLDLVRQLDPSAHWTVSDIRSRVNGASPHRPAVAAGLDWLRAVKRK